VFIVTVYPLKPIYPLNKQAALSYFSSLHLKRGALITVPIKNKLVLAIVAHTDSIKQKKLFLKTSPFQVKRIHSIICDAPFFHTDLITISKKLSEFYVQQEGVILRHFFPSYILKHCKQLSPYVQKEFSLRKSTTPTLVTGSINVRLKEYQNIINDHIQKNNIVWLVTPTIAFVEYFYKHLKTKAEKVIMLHAKLPVKTLIENWEAARNKKGLLVIGTPVILGTLHHAVSAIILDNASSPHMRYPHIPYINIRHVFRNITEEKTITYAEGLITPLTDDVYDIKRGAVKLQETRHPRQNGTRIFIDMQKEQHKKGAFPILSESLMHEIKKSNSRMICFLNRKGYSPLILCKDCGSALYCPSCKAPMTLHKKDKKRFFICHHCGHTMSAETQCAVCDSWNLTAYGIGTQRLEEEMKKLAPEKHVFRFDADTIKNNKERKKIFEQFLQTKHGILIGTEMVFEEPELYSPFIAIISVDHMLTLPDFRINEQVLRILETLAAKCEILMLQSFLTDHLLIKSFLKHESKRYFIKELQERKKAYLPPYSLMIKVVLENKNKALLIKQAQQAEMLLKHINAHTQSVKAFIPKKMDRWRWHIFLRVSLDQWVKNEDHLKRTLANLEGNYSIVVDPASTL